MSKTNFQKVQDFNEATGTTRFSEHKLDVFTENPDVIDLRISLITEEVGELQQAIKDHNFTEVRDALADILYVVYGMADALGIDADKDFNIVHDSNMSKLCTSEEEAKQTVAYYQTLYTEGNSPYDSPVYHFLPKLNKWVIKNDSTKKVLKSINYNKVDFTT